MDKVLSEKIPTIRTKITKLFTKTYVNSCMHCEGVLDKDIVLFKPKIALMDYDELTNYLSFKVKLDETAFKLEDIKELL